MAFTVERKSGQREGETRASNEGEMHEARVSNESTWITCKLDSSGQAYDIADSPRNLPRRYANVVAS